MPSRSGIVAAAVTSLLAVAGAAAALGQGPGVERIGDVVVVDPASRPAPTNAPGPTADPTPSPAPDQAPAPAAPPPPEPGEGDLPGRTGSDLAPDDATDGERDDDDD